MDVTPLLQSSDSENEASASNLLPPTQFKDRQVYYEMSFKQLTKLIKAKDVEQLQEALKGRNLQLSDASGRTLLHVAVETNDIDTVMILLDNERGQSLLNRQDDSGMTPLMAALEAKCFQTLELLCIRGADPNKTLTSGDTVLHKATDQFDCKAAKILLRYFKTPDFLNALNTYGDTALIECVREKSPVFELLLDAGADLTIQNSENGRTVMHVAVAYNRQNMLQRCVQHPLASVEFADATDVQGETALIIAVKLEKLELIQILTGTYNNLNGINKLENESCLHYAIQLNRPDILKHILHSTTPAIHYCDSKKRSPLMYAAELDNAQCLEELVDFGADYFEKNIETGETILHTVARLHSNAVLPFLVTLHHITWFLDQVDYQGNTPYMCAIRSGNDVFLREALKLKKVNLCDYNPDGETAIYYVAKQGYLNVLQTLLLSPMYYSFAKRNPVVIESPEEILKAEIRGDIYNTDVYILLRKHIKLPLVTWFPPSLLLKTKENRNVFHGCALGSSIDCLEFLHQFFKLFAPKDSLNYFDSPGIHGNTPLLVAAKCGPPSELCVTYFVNNGANLAATSDENVSVVQAMFEYNPRATQLFVSLFDSCVTGKKEFYYSDEIRLKVDFSMLCPKEESQTKVITLLFSKTKGNNRRVLLQHPVLEAFLKNKFYRVRGIFLLRFVMVCVATVLISFLAPMLYIGKASPVEKYGLFWTVVMRGLFILSFLLYIFNAFFKIPPIVRRNLFISDIVALVPPATILILLVFGKTFYFVPEVAALSILSSWTNSLVMSVNIYSSFSYQMSVFFRLLQGISKHMFVLSIIIFAFSLSFFCVFHDEKRFASISSSFMYTLIVVLPGLVSDLPTFKYDYYVNTPFTFHFLVECIVIGTFLVVAITSFVNMLVGLAVRGGRHLETDGKIFKSDHEAHFLSNIDFWFTNKSSLWLMRKRPFKCLRKLRKYVLVDLVFDVYAEENKGVCDDTVIKEFRGIVFRRYQAERSSMEDKSEGSLDDLFDEPYVNQLRETILRKAPTSEEPKKFKRYISQTH